jgi:hypothetical protein
MSTIEVWGRIGDKLAKDVFVATIKEHRDLFITMREIHASGKNTKLSSDLRDIEAAIKLYDMLVANPLDFKEKRVNAILASLPNSVAGHPIIPDKRVAIHVGVSYEYKDYSSMIPKKEVAGKYTMVPVQAFRSTPKEAWRDPIIEVLRGQSLDGFELKAGVYVRCVGIAPVWGGSVEPCVYDDEVRIIDMPRHHCKACSDKLIKIRAKARKSGHNIGGPDRTAVLNDLLKDLA